MFVANSVGRNQDAVKTTSSVIKEEGGQKRVNINCAASRQQLVPKVSVSGIRTIEITNDHEIRGGSQSREDVNKQGQVPTFMVFMQIHVNRPDL